MRNLPCKRCQSKGLPCGLPECAPGLGGHDQRARFLDTPYGHAEMLGLDSYKNSCGFKLAGYGISYLGRHSLLDLEPGGNDVNRPYNLAHPNDPPGFRLVGHPHLADKG